MKEDNTYKRVEVLLYNYKTNVAEIREIRLSIIAVKRDYLGCSAITYEERVAPTNKFNSTVENEILQKEETVDNLRKELNRKRLLVLKIRNAIGTLDDRERDIIEYKYFKKIKSWERIGELVGLTGDYCRSLNKEIITKIGNIIFITEKYMKNLG